MFESGHSTIAGAVAVLPYVRKLIYETCWKLKGIEDFNKKAALDRQKSEFSQALCHKI